MNTHYSIKDLERLSGIKAHTIRIWEQRYQVISPKRTDTNIRYYQDSDLRKILNVSFLVHENVKISKVAKLNDEEMHAMVLDMSRYNGGFVAELNALKMAMFEYNQEEFDRTFDHCIETYGEDKTFIDVLGAFLEQLGVLWLTQTIAVSHEHFVSNLIKQKLYAAIDKLKVKVKADAKTYLLYLPSNEYHEIGLLHLQYFLKKRGERVIYLGQNTPHTYLSDVFKKNPFCEILSVFTSAPHCDEVVDYLNILKKNLNGHDVKMRFSGYQLQDLLENGYDDESILLYKNLEEMRQGLISLKE